MFCILFFHLFTLSLLTNYETESQITDITTAYRSGRCNNNYSLPFKS